MLHIVCGAPCAGKTTYISEHKEASDMVVDLDALAGALGAQDKYSPPKDIKEAAFKARKAAIEHAKNARGNTWIIHSAPDNTQLEHWQSLGAQIHFLDVDQCSVKEISNFLFTVLDTCHASPWVSSPGFHQ